MPGAGKEACLGDEQRGGEEEKGGEHYSERGSERPKPPRLRIWGRRESQLRQMGMLAAPPK